MKRDMKDLFDQVYIAKLVEEERAWRKALLDFLAVPNMGITDGEYIKKSDFIKRFENLRRFLPK